MCSDVLSRKSLAIAIEQLHLGNLIAYPTESIYGLGCDPFNESAVLKLIDLKNRSVLKGLILVISDWDHLKKLDIQVSKEQYEIMSKTWPGNVTWLVPKSKKIPSWIAGKFDTVAIRMPDHIVPRQLAKDFGGPIVSTSANLKDSIPCRTYSEVKEVFGDSIDYIVPGDVGGYSKPSIIRDLVTLEIIRS